MKLTVKGQVTIPQAIRRKCGFRPGMDVDIEEEQGKVVIRKARKHDPVGRIYGILSNKNSWKNTDQIIERLRGH